MIGRLIEKVRNSRGLRAPNDPQECAGTGARLAELAERRARYLKAVESGDLAFPASERIRRGQTNSSIRQIWEDTRLEAFNYLWSFGPEPPRLLADDKKQNALLYTYFSLKLGMYFRLKQIPSNSIKQLYYTTWLAVFNAYSHLDDLGWMGYSQPNSDKPAHILEDLNASIHELQKTRLKQEKSIKRFFSNWHEKELLFDIIYSDITKKSKFIAMSAILDNDDLIHYEMRKNNDRVSLNERGQSEKYISYNVSKCKKIESDLLYANDPDDLA